MESAERRGEAFALDDLWKASIFAIGSYDLDANQLRPLDYGFGEEQPLREVVYGKSDWFQIPDLDNFSFSRPPPPPLPSTPSASLTSESRDDSEDELDTFDSFQALDTAAAPLPSWERFYDGDFWPKITYLSELGAPGLDAALSRLKVRGQPSSHIVRTDVASRALGLLALGIESVLFQYRAADHTFALTADVRMSSLSPHAFRSLVSTFANYGQLLKHSREAAQRICVSPRPLPTMNALASAVLAVTETLYSALVHDLEGCRSVIALQSSFRRPAHILEYLNRLLEAVEGAQNDAAMLSRAYMFVESTGSLSPWLHSILQQVLRKAATPWLSTVSATLGLGDTIASNRRLASVLKEEAQSYAKGESDPDFRSAIPEFLEYQDRITILGACACLDMLKKYDESSILTHFSRYRHVSPPPLVWSMQWWDLRETESQSERYDRELQESIRHPSRHKPDPPLESSGPQPRHSLLDPYGAFADGVHDAYATSLLDIEQIPTSRDTAADDLREAVQLAIRKQDSLTAQTQLYPLSFGLHLSISPVLMVQNRHLNRACLRMLFDRFNLREHFTVHYRYNLFGDGLFAARLAEALFSPELSATDQHDKYTRAGKLGLRLEERSSWPPGGPELRLALMGILNDSYFGPSMAVGADQRELPGNLSFGIRNLSEAEIQAVLDPGSLHALDFLRLKYIASAPLDTIFTESAIEKYDSIFKLLLRIARILAVAKHLCPNRRSAISEAPTAAAFRIAASRFVEALSSYYLQSGIASPWSKFQARIAALETSLRNEDEVLEGGIETVFALRAAHDQMLDSIMFALLLRRRQAPVMKLLEEIFETILAFVKIQLSNDINGATNKEISLLYKRLREKVNVLIAVCRGLSERKAYVAGAIKEGETIGETGIEQLVLRLEMNGWWTQAE